MTPDALHPHVLKLCMEMADVLKEMGVEYQILVIKELGGPQRLAEIRATLNLENSDV